MLSLYKNGAFTAISAKRTLIRTIHSLFIKGIFYLQSVLIEVKR